jgi:hypothetical protein
MSSFKDECWLLMMFIGDLWVLRHRWLLKIAEMNICNECRGYESYQVCSIGCELEIQQRTMKSSNPMLENSQIFENKVTNI